MGSNVTPSQMRGFLIPRKQSLDSIWEDESTATQQTPVAGVPVAQQSTGLVLQTAGEMASNEHIEIMTQRAGHASSIGRARFVWRDATTGDYYGRNTANTIDWWEQVAGTTMVDFLPRDLVTTGDGYSYVVCEKQDGAALTAGIVIIRRNRDGSHETPKVISAFPVLSFTNKYHAAIDQLADGSIICVHANYDGASATVNVNVHRSIDNGNTWSKVSTNALDQSIDTSTFTIERIRIGVNKGQIMMLIGGDDSSNMLVNQYVSTDNGGTFQFVATTDTGAGDNFGFPEIVVVNGIFGVAIVEDENKCYFHRFANAYLPIDVVLAATTLKIEIVKPSDGVTIYDAATTPFSKGISSMWLDDDETIWIVFHRLSTAALRRRDAFIMKSPDFGSTWIQMGDGLVSGGDIGENGQWWSLDLANVYLTRAIGGSVGGTQIVYHNWNSINATTTEGNLGVFHLGGYSSVTMPPVDELSGDEQRGGFTVNWVPWDLPNDVGFSTSGAGTASINTTGYMNVSTSGNDKGFTKSITNGLNTGVILRVSFLVQSGVGANDVHVTARISDGSSTDYYVSLRADVGGFTLYDENGSASLAVVPYDMTDRTEFIIALANGDVAAWYRQADPQPKKWIEIHQGSVTSGSGTTSNVGFGNITTSTNTTHWFEFYYSDSDRVGLQLANGQANPDEIWCRNYPPKGKFTQITGGLSITTADGGTYENDEWHIDAGYEYPIQNVFYPVSPSTRTVWRSETSATSVVPSMLIPWFVDDDSQSATYMMNDVMAVHLNNINFKDFTIERHDGSSWNVVATVENTVYDGGFVRNGAALRATATSGFPYFFHHECAGWYAIMGDGDNLAIRKIRTNTEGAFKLSGGKLATITLDGVDGTEPTSGTLEIVPTSITVLIMLNGPTNNRTAKSFGIRIGAQDTMEQYFQIGTLAFGEIVIPGKQYSRGRSIRFESGVEIDERIDGSYFTRSTGNDGRLIRVAWSDGVDISDLYTTDADPNYFQASTTAGAEPVAAFNDVPDMMMGFIRYLEGPSNPLVYLPYFDKSESSSTDVQIFNRYSNHMLAVLNDDVTITNVLGDEWNGIGTGEVQRVATILLREIR
jgi:hypothetical protein